MRLFHCAAPSVSLGLVKIYFYQMLSALLTWAYLSHCSSAHLIRFAWLNMKSTIQEATHNYVWWAQITGDFYPPQLPTPMSSSSIWTENVPIRFDQNDFSTFWNEAWATYGEIQSYTSTMWVLLVFQIVIKIHFCYEISINIANVLLPFLQWQFRLRILANHWCHAIGPTAYYSETPIVQMGHLTFQPRPATLCFWLSYPDILILT